MEGRVKCRPRRCSRKTVPRAPRDGYPKSSLLESLGWPVSRVQYDGGTGQPPAGSDHSSRKPWSVVRLLKPWSGRGASRCDVPHCLPGCDSHWRKSPISPEVYLDHLGLSRDVPERFFVNCWAMLSHSVALRPICSTTPRMQDRFILDLGAGCGLAGPTWGG